MKMLDLLHSGIKRLPAGMFAAAAVCVMVCVDGFVFMVLWSWFIAPLGLPLLSFPQAMGVVTIVGFACLTYRPVPKDKELHALKMMLLRPPLYLAIGWVVHLFL